MKISLSYVSVALLAAASARCSVVNAFSSIRTAPPQPQHHSIDLSVRPEPAFLNADTEEEDFELTRRVVKFQEDVELTRKVVHGFFRDEFADRGDRNGHMVDIDSTMAVVNNDDDPK